ncbi:hypothetical protein SEPCBS57363_004218 [Sporothrix epigloea]|uniref:Uncharacterized protein n=1 Tax=Sporothrix epigloea TaxID=1892477 RepID=A0ABP0DQT7_9PEZI
MDWFRSSLDLFQKQDGHHHSEMDSRYPMVLITGLPAVGKSAVARELANLLEGSHDRFAQGNKTRPSAREAAWTFFVDPRRRPRPGLLRSPGPTGCRRRACSSPVEYFADGKAIVVNVDHLSCMEDLRENQKSDTSEKGATAADSATQTASEVRWYCNSLASLQPGFQAAPETIRRLDRGRRLAMERYVMPKETKESSIILTECLYDDDRNGKSETAAAAYKTAATVFQRRLIPIYLTCELSEHQRRFKCRQRDAAEILRDIQDPAKTLNIPENDITALTPDQGLDKASAFFKHQAKAEGSLYIFSKPADYKDGRFSVPAKTRVGDFEQIDLPSEYQGCRIDTTGLTPLEVAGIIQKFCQDVMRGRPLQTWEGWKKDKTPEGDGGDKKQKSRSKTECLFIN